MLVEIKRGNLKLIRTAFVAKVAHGGIGGKMVLVRKGKNRFPLEVKRTVSVAEMVGSQTVADRLKTLIDKRLPEELSRLITLWGK